VPVPPHGESSLTGRKYVDPSMSLPNNAVFAYRFIRISDFENVVSLSAFCIWWVEKRSGTITGTTIRIRV
jgi:hypothetical protein